MSRRARTRRDRRDPIPDFDGRPEARIRGDFAGCHYWRGLHLWAILARRRAQSILGSGPLTHPSSECRAGQRNDPADLDRPSGGAAGASGPVLVRAGRHPETPGGFTPADTHGLLPCAEVGGGHTASTLSRSETSTPRALAPMSATSCAFPSSGTRNSTASSFSPSSQARQTS